MYRSQVEVIDVDDMDDMPPPPPRPRPTPSKSPRAGSMALWGASKSQPKYIERKYPTLKVKLIPGKSEMTYYPNPYE